MTNARALAAVLAVAGLALATADAAPAQEIARRVAAAPDGVVRISFSARPGVCGHRGGVTIHRHADDGGGRGCDCEHGPVRVALTVESGRVTALRTRVGGRWEPAPDASTGTTIDLGRAPAPAAADYFLSLAARLEGGAAEDAVLPAVIADSATVWPALLEIARDADRPRGVRKKSVFWVGQAAAVEATRGLEEVAWSEGDREVREHAVFALSRRPDDEGVPALIRIVRENPDPGLRRKAVFWLGRSEDPRALALFEELLTRR